MISLDLMKSSEVRMAADWFNCGENVLIALDILKSSEVKITGDWSIYS